MIPFIFGSSLALALLTLPLLAWKWCIKIWVAIAGAVFIGGLTGFIMSKIESAMPGLNIAFFVLIELSLILIIAFLLILFRFYRDPERRPGETKNVILAPADGRVIYINNVENDSSLVSTKGNKKFELEKIASTYLLANAAYLLGIDMNMLNVHVNRSPIGGKVILCKHTKGSFVSLRKQESEIMNERVTTIIDNHMFKIGVIQISSRLVRKIVSYIREGDNIDIGQRIGAITFGSQVDVVLPKLNNLRIEVKPGVEVKAGVSVIARYG